ncbi:alkaline phosphatase D family protein [Streptomonospora sp. S1-112]|uniref:Alkaline phosphatase D family protein n=1 Tax=Streptomonospora mangrovi TaxID=2883123 RepID=A0A9X3NJP3_9ACTN|nr:alkaline phosphatase D family protein [Streptomonospora mangrovi]MDA0564518.1 alkaline phosphatase D family protein [Streptomonospora mangrovi]
MPAILPSARTAAWLKRRRFLGIGTASAAAVALGTGLFASAPASADNRRSPGYPFTLGVASGDPAHDGFVLWTRLAPEPLAEDGSGGMPPEPVDVEYEVALDAKFSRVVRRGTAVASPELGHSVHPEITGLSPAREYHYRFRALNEVSPAGTARTAPPPTSLTGGLAFAFVSCQKWDQGHYTAYEHLAQEDLDLVLHLGDYIYEYPIEGDLRGSVPDHLLVETTRLEHYRVRYALYKSDPHLQAAHARFSWVVTPDDHEVDNNWADEISQDDDPPAEFLDRRAQAFQAYYENMPLRRASMPVGPDMGLHRRLAYGQLADFTMLDTRQYRDDQPCGGRIVDDCPERFAEDHSILGEAQREWLVDGFRRSQARWHVLGNQSPMTQTDHLEGEAERVWTDPWDGYAADRERVLTAAVDQGVRNLVVVTGDRHQNYAADLKADYRDEDAATVAAEFVGTSVATGGDGQDVGEQGRAFLAANPHFHFVNEQRGYVRCRLTPREWRTDFRVVPYVSRPGAPVSTRATFVVEDGQPGVVQSA